MPAKRPAAKSTKGKKAASRPAPRKALGRKADTARARVVVAHARKSVPPAAPRKPAVAHPADAPAEPAAELKKTPRPVPAAPGGTPPPNDPAERPARADRGGECRRR